MGTFLQVVGVTALIIIAVLLIVIVGGFFIIRSKFRKFATEMKKIADGAEFMTVPARIHLKPCEKLDWKDARKAEAEAAAFTAAEFDPAGYYEVEELPGVLLQGFAKPKSGLYGVICEREPVGVWSDCVFTGEGDTSLTVTNAPRGDEIDSRPGQEKLYLQGQNAADLIERAAQESRGKASRPISTEQFVEDFETAYAKSMDWRNSRGGTTEEEIRRVALKRGEPVDDEVIQMTLGVKRAEALQGLEVALREKYLTQSNLSASEWERQRKRLTFIHDRLTAEYVKNALLIPDEEEDEKEEPEEPEVDLTNSTPRGEFSRLNGQRSIRDRFEKIGELSEPLPADVYLAPRDYYFGD